MILGDPATFAIEFRITTVFERLSYRGLGYFVLHVDKQQYGVRSEHATMLACSFDEVAERLSGRGTHLASFSEKNSACDIASCVYRALYCSDCKPDTFFGMEHSEFCGLIHEHHLLWAPDGDAAFDDDSFVLQFDVGNQVRLIAFKSDPSSACFVQNVAETWISGDLFYKILSEFLWQFEHARAAMLLSNHTQPTDRGSGNK